MSYSLQCPITDNPTGTAADLGTRFDDAWHASPGIYGRASPIDNGLRQQVVQNLTSPMADLDVKEACCNFPCGLAGVLFLGQLLDQPRRTKPFQTIDLRRFWP